MESSINFTGARRIESLYCIALERHMTWFEALTGFREGSPGQVRQNITAEGEILKSRVNGRLAKHI
jgi:hypothetical protein